MQNQIYQISCGLLTFVDTMVKREVSNRGYPAVITLRNPFFFSTLLGLLGNMNEAIIEARITQQVGLGMTDMTVMIFQVLI